MILLPLNDKTAASPKRRPAGRRESAPKDSAASHEHPDAVLGGSIVRCVV